MFEGLSHQFLKIRHNELYNEWLKNENMCINDAESIENVMICMKNVLQSLNTTEKSNYIVVHIFVSDYHEQSAIIEFLLYPSSGIG